jgi:type I restriction enzyme S subunit
MNAIHQLLTDHIDIWTAVDTEKKSGSGRSSGNAASVYGIKKLRELILELAVRGKLVPQDPSDEPASELLKRIRVEKAKLIVEGKIKKDKPLKTIADDEKPFELPKNWEWVRLGDVSQNVQYGYTASADHTDRNVLMMRITDIQENQVNWKTVPGCSISESDFASYALSDGDIVIARTGGTIGKSYLISDLSDRAVFASYLIRVQRLVNGLPSYTKVFLGSLLYWNQLFASSMGTGQPNVNGTALKSLIFPLPPLTEQHRIVAKVDELMALCDQLESQHNAAAEAHEKLVSHLLGTLTQSQSAEDFSANWQRIAAHFDSLFTTEASIDALKQALLQLAVMGKLVPQDPNDEPANELLKRIQAEKAKLISEGKIKKDKLLPLVADDEKPFPTPHGWHWVKFDYIAENSKYALKAGPFGSALKKDMYSQSGYKIYGQEQVISGDENFGDYFIDHKKFQQLSSCAVKPGDILISLVGTIGRVLVLSENCKLGIINPRLVKISLFKEIDRSYFKVIFASPLLRNEMADRSHGGTMNILNLGLLRALALPLPPIEEQHRIVAKVDELMVICDALKTRINEAQRIQIHVADTVVNQALA